MQNVEREGFAGLNSDDEDRAMPKGDYRSATNIRNGSSDTGSVGAIENLKGNLQIEDNLPSGNYKTVGVYEDVVGNSVIYFLSEKILIPPPSGSPAKEDTVIWYGLIMRFFIDTEEIVTISRSRSFEFTEDSNIHSIDLVDDKLYWTDGETEPKKININKGNNSSVPRKINIFFPDAYELYWDTNVYTGSIEITDDFNDSVFTVYIPEIGGVPTTLDSFSSQAAAAINDQVEGDNTIVANACGSFLQIEFLNPGNSDIEFLTGGFDFLVVPDNFYKSINTDVVNQIKASPACQPSFELFANTARLSNYITKKNFQFAVRYVFDDNEKTTLSPYSLISYPEVSYGNPNENLNGIRIFYTDDRLLDVSSRAVIKQVELCFREGNGGKWKLIESLTEAEIGAKEVDHFFDFYNDEAYTFLPEAESNINYHEVPKKSDTQEFVENRLYHGGITRGFDPVCVEADINIGYNDPIEVPNTYSISGSILIKNKFKSSPYDQQVIWQEEEDGAIKFGGVDSGSKLDTDIDYDQGIPLGGFVVYLAGTDFYDITDQDVLASAPSVGNKGVYRAWSGSDKSAMETAIGTGPIYQRFEIKNVPPGRYVMRVASHKTTSDSLANGSYQNTSTTVSYDPRVSLVWGTEKIVEVTSANVIYDPAVEGFSVIDLSDPGSGTSRPQVGYLTEDNDAGDFNPFGAPMELSRVGISDPTSGSFVSGPIFSLITSVLVNAYTDHNGFYYAANTGNGIVGTKMSVDGSQTKSLSNFLSIKAFYEDGSFVSNIYDTYQGKKMSTLYLQGSNPNLDVSSKVKIKGIVRNDAGFGAEGVVIVPRFARPTQTDSNGNYSKELYGDTHLYDTSVSPPNAARRDPSVLTIGYPLWANFDVDNSGYPLIGVGTNTGYFNVSNPFELNDNEITSSEVGGGSGFKRGYDGRFGIIYRDNGSRVSQVFTDESLQTHVNFYTERNEYGVQENYGKPSLEWSIAHKAPEWATNYQWVRTKNESALDFFQFIISDVTFYDEDNNVTGVFASAVKVVMNLANITQYGDQNPGTTVSMPASIDLDWRIRFINTAGGSYYDFFDEALVEAGPTTLAIAKNSEIEPLAGGLIEVYRPQRLSETKLYYEFGQCYEVINGFHQGPAKNQSEWKFTDNQFNTGNLSFIGSGSHDFVVGQIVDVYQDYPYTNGTYNGKATIIEIPTSNSIVLDKAFGAASGPEGGVVIGRASGVFERGDSYYRTRVMTYNNLVDRVTKAIEDPNISDFYDSEHTDIGRLHIEAPLEKEEKEESLIVFSDFLDEASNINKLNDFIGVNNELLPIEYGAIRKLIKANNVLLSICELRTVSLYINEAVITSASGDDTLVATERVIGNVRAMQDHYGTINPESVYEREGTVVFWDGLKGAVVQVSSNGLFPISSFKMVKHFNDISKAFLKSGKDMRVYGVHDQYFKDNLLVFEGVTGFVDPQTVVYSNQIKRWTSFRDYVPERVASTSMKLITFNDGKLYVHNSNPIHNNFYGTQYTSKIQTVSNENAKNIKVFRAMSYESNLPWSAPLITVPANSQYKLGMQSRLKAGKFINKEGIYYSEFLKDLNSPGFATATEALIDGRDLRGKVLEMVLESDNTEHTVLFSLNVKSTPSEMSNR